MRAARSINRVLDAEAAVERLDQATIGHWTSKATVQKSDIRLAVDYIASLKRDLREARQQDIH